MINSVEILAPAGSFKSLQASFKAGADAVYMGGRRFGARAYCENPEDEDLVKAISYAHARGKRLYLTVNTVVKEQEIRELFDFLAPLYVHGLDAVIVQDLGLVKLLQTNFPELPIHLSTQMSVTEAHAVEELGDNVTRVVPARELTIEEIAKLKESTGIELEVFVHGALCYSYSGQCLFSAMCGDRSGNRGRCAQPCRKKYETLGKKAYVLSPKDINTLNRLPDIIEAGVDSFKIEGRMKSPEYAAGVAMIYRRACDLYFEKGRDGYYEYIKSHKSEWDEYQRNLGDLFNRGGFSSGYAFDNPGPGMMAINRPNHEGVYVGRALIKGGQASLKTEIELFKGDVLEIRNNNQAEWYSYTLPEYLPPYVKSKKYVKFKAYSKVYSSRIEGSEVDVYRYRAQGLLDSLDNDYVNAKDGIKVVAELKAVAGEELELSVKLAKPHKLTGEEYKITAKGGVVDVASNRPVSEEFVSDKILRSGDSEFEIIDLSVNLSDNAFLPKSVLGKLRREALDLLAENIDDSFKRRAVENLKYSPDEILSTTVARTEKGKAAKLHILPTNMEQLTVALEDSKVGGIIIDQQFELFNNLLDSSDAVNRITESGKEVYLRTLHIYDESNKKYHSMLLKLLEDEKIARKISGVYVRNLSILSLLKKSEMVKKTGIGLIADYNLYAANSWAISKLIDMGFDGFTYSPELTKRECLAIENTSKLMSVIDVYARTELMLSKQCIKKTLGKCNKTKEWNELISEGGNCYKYYSLCDECKNIIIDDEPVSVMGQTLELNCSINRIILSDEKKLQVMEILQEYNANMTNGEASSSKKTGHFYATVQ